jgi:hypothetical protein
MTRPSGAHVGKVANDSAAAAAAGMGVPVTRATRCKKIDEEGVERPTAESVPMADAVDVVDAVVGAIEAAVGAADRRLNKSSRVHTQWGVGTAAVAATSSCGSGGAGGTTRSRGHS